MKLLVALALVLMGANVTATSSITAPPVSAGQSVMFTETYPKEAARQARQPQFPDNPVTQVNCGSAWVGRTIVQDKHPIPGGWQSTTYPLLIPVSGTCTAALYSGVDPGTVVIWATLVFEVAP